MREDAFVAEAARTSRSCTATVSASISGATPPRGATHARHHAERIGGSGGRRGGRPSDLSMAFTAPLGEQSERGRRIVEVLSDGDALRGLNHGVEPRLRRRSFVCRDQLDEGAASGDRDRAIRVLREVVSDDQSLPHENAISVLGSPRCVPSGVRGAAPHLRDAGTGGADERSMGRIIGIDLGTTNSCVAIR